MCNGRYYATAIPAPYRQPDMRFVYTEASYQYDSLLTTYFSAITFAQDLWLLRRPRKPWPSRCTPISTIGKPSTRIPSRS